MINKAETFVITVKFLSGMANIWDQKRYNFFV